MSESDTPPFFILNQKNCVVAGQASLGNSSKVVDCGY
jgi:hypothetical protein